MTDANETLESVYIEANGDIELVFADGNLFCVHIIEVHGAGTRELKRAKISG